MGCFLKMEEYFNNAIGRIYVDDYEDQGHRNMV